MATTCSLIIAVFTIKITTQTSRFITNLTCEKYTRFKIQLGCRTAARLWIKVNSTCTTLMLISKSTKLQPRHKHSKMTGNYANSWLYFS